MRLVLLGDADDARGFRLAGVESTVCRTRDDAQRAVDECLHGDRPAGVVLVSECVYRLAPMLFDELQDRPRWPIVMVLPAPGTEQRSVV